VALGAQAAQVQRMLLGHVLLLVGAGVALGLGGAALLTQLMESLLLGVTALDVPTYVAGAAILVLNGVLAGYLPARRATRVEPKSALRAEQRGARAAVPCPSGRCGIGPITHEPNALGFQDRIAGAER
jgi:predicted lysophospholipase L1 biosynthesis ABC-type transport system permease subunit